MSSPSTRRLRRIYIRELPGDLVTPLGVYLALRRPGDEGFLLESVEYGRQVGRYSIAGAGASAIIESRGDAFHVGGENPNTAPAADALEFLRRAGGDVLTPEGDLPPFLGGWVGAMSYDFIRRMETLPDTQRDDLHAPDLRLALFETVVIHDRLLGRLLLSTLAKDTPGGKALASRRLDDLQRRLEAVPGAWTGARLAMGEPRANMTRAEFESAVREIKERIVEGDVFQAVLSRRLSAEFRGDPLEFYRALRRVNPSPYMVFLEGAGPSVVGASPEMLLRCLGGVVDVRPIAGTRPRGASPAEDDALARQLLNDPKERAEHAMLLDLGRNDLGRVCEYGSVRVREAFTVERYSHVMHMVSRVDGCLKPGENSLSALAAAFPAGTVSGAPKVEAMALLDRLEPTRRGIYAGAILYLDHGGNLDSCIAIRTAVFQDGLAHFQAGAGIVADSDPAREFEETEDKMRALLHAAERAP